VSHAGARAKGLQFERYVANCLGHIFPEAERQLEYQASKVIGVDIEGTDRIKIQCKNHQNYCSIGTIHEIRCNGLEDIPVLVTKGNRLEPMAVLPFDKLVKLLEIAYGIELPFRTLDGSSDERRSIREGETQARLPALSASYLQELEDELPIDQPIDARDPSNKKIIEVEADVVPSGNWRENPDDLGHIFEPQSLDDLI